MWWKCILPIWIFLRHFSFSAAKYALRLSFGIRQSCKYHHKTPTASSADSLYQRSCLLVSYKNHQYLFTLSYPIHLKQLPRWDFTRKKGNSNDFASIIPTSFELRLLLSVISLSYNINLCLKRSHTWELLGAPPCAWTGGRCVRLAAPNVVAGFCSGPLSLSHLANGRISCLMQRVF